MAQFRSFAGSEGARALSQQLLIAAAAFLMATLMTMGGTLWNLKNSLHGTEAEENTMLELTTIESRLVDIQGSLYAVAATRNDWFQQRIDTDIAQMNASAQKLQRSLQSHPGELPAYGQLAALMRTHAGLTDYLRQPGHLGGAQWQDDAHSARMVVAAARHVLWQILDDERQSRYASQRQMTAEAVQSFWLAIGIVALTALMAACVFSLRATTPAPKAQLR